MKGERREKMEGELTQRYERGKEREDGGGIDAVI